MSSLKTQLQQLLDKVGDSWTPEERALAESIAQDYVTLMAKRVGGDDVTAELAHVRAQATSIVTAGSLGLATVLEEAILDFLTKLILELGRGR